MERESPSIRQPRRLPRVPPFYPVPTRARRDGWTTPRQAEFLGMLAETGSVMGACEAVGMSRKSAYALRARPGAESFAAAWDAALGAPVRKVTVADRFYVAHHGLVRWSCSAGAIADRGKSLTIQRFSGCSAGSTASRRPTDDRRER